MERSSDEEEDSSQAAKLTVRVKSQMEWLDPAAADQLSWDAGTRRGTWQALQGTEEAGRRAAVKQCLLVSSSLGISSSLPLVLRCSFSLEENG